MKNCTQCQSSFEVTESDRKLIEAVSPVIAGQKYLIPDPTLCPDCRMQRRMTFRNERKLYRSKSALSGKSMVSLYSPKGEHPAYTTSEWWSDAWDGTEYGQDFDFSRPFFEQFGKLLAKVPSVALWVMDSQNSEFNNNCFNLKDCYLSVNTDRSERTFYSYRSYKCIDCTDCTTVYESQLCYECIDCVNCHHCFYSQDLENSNDCHFSTDLKGCKYCFGCHGLRNKEYYIFNKKITPEEWQERVGNFDFTHEEIETFKKQSYKISLTVPKRNLHLINCQNSMGEYLHNCKNVTESYEVVDSEDVKYCMYAPFESKSILDGYAFGAAELAYELIGGGFGIFNVAFIVNPSHGPSDSYYCVQCVNGTKNCFGCVGLQKKEYCILNKQYSKEEYEALLPKIIEHMKNTEEWGEFFPPTISPFAYNETVAQYYYPLTKQKALNQGWKWSDYEPEVKAEKTIPANRLPGSIKDIPDDILNWAIVCEESGRPFKIIPQELKFYRRLNLPVPRLHPDVRDAKRMNMRNSPVMHERKCAKCQKNMKTTYSPDRPEVVYCEACYLSEIY